MVQNCEGNSRSSVRGALAVASLLGALALQACATTPPEPECEAPNYLDANGVCVAPAQ